ncbi:hypothetical protein [Candidatus Kuenenia sp.]|uniref:hypothetical protein n=1 Tax=Candidatus Kuenenia sp. TaxID=2499824 RepID=UPI002A6C261C|nr:hypothetical protein [Candidatus Kuenenia stuttgartiensis]
MTLASINRHFRTISQTAGNAAVCLMFHGVPGYALLCRIIEASIAIDGHHKGLPDKSAWKSDTEPFNRGEVSGFEKIKRDFIRYPCQIVLPYINIIDQTSVAELLHDLGTLARIAYLPLQYKEALILAKDRNIPIPEAEQKILD